MQNRFFFNNLNDYLVYWTLSEDGKEIQHGSTTIGDIPANQKGTLNIPYSQPKMKAGSRYLLKLSMRTINNEKWADAGFELAKQQFELVNNAKAEKTANAKAVSVNDSKSNIIVGNDGFSATFDKMSGYLTSYSVNGQSIIEAALKPNFWRVGTDNDLLGWHIDKNLGVWDKATQGLTLKDIKVEETANLVTIQATHTFENSINVAITYKVDGEGNITVNFKLDADEKLSGMPRLGMTTIVNKSLANMSFFGRGPFENYADRNNGADIDLYEGTVKDFLYEYVRPQENSNRTDIDWLSLASNNHSLTINGVEPLSMSVWPYSTENLSKSAHTYDLKDQGAFTVNIDLIQAGVGGNDSWSWRAAPIKQYQIPAGKYEYTFTLSVK